MARLAYKETKSGCRHAPRPRRNVCSSKKVRETLGMRPACSVRPARRCVWLAAMALLIARPSPALAQVGIDSLEVRSVSFDGADSFDRRVLATAIMTSPTRCTAVAPLCWLGIGVDRQYLSANQLALDTLRLKLFYYQQGYRETAFGVDTTRDGARLRVRFRIDEGEPVRVASIGIDGRDTLAAAVFRNLPLAVGAPLSLTVFEATRDTIIVRLRNRGYAQAEALANITIDADSPRTAHVRYEPVPGPLARFGPIAVVGADRVSEDVVRRMLTFRSGDLYSDEHLLGSLRNLFAQEVFRHASVEPELDPGDETVIPVRVQVNEGDLHRVRGGVGASTAEYVNLEGRWVSRSFQGGARRLELRARVSNVFANTLPDLPIFEATDDFYGRLSGLVSADFTQPWFFDAVNTLGAGTFAERRSIPEVFVRTAVGGYVTFNRLLGPGTSMTLGFRPERTRLESKDDQLVFCLGFTACGEEDIAALREPNWLSPLTATIGRDRSNSIFAPSRGYSIRLDAEFAASATGSDFGYTRLAAELIDYHTIVPGVIWALRLKPSLAHTLDDAPLGLHPQKRYFAGGPNSVRGFAQFRLGPKLLVADALRHLVRSPEEGGAGCTAQQVNAGTCDARAFVQARPNELGVQAVGGAVSVEGNVELRFPVYGDLLRAAAFVDFGQVWEDEAGFDLGDVVSTPGLGLRYFSPIGPVRIDVGYYGGRGETLTVVSTGVCEIASTDECVLDPDREYMFSELRNDRSLRALATPVRWNPRRSFFDRLQLHFSIGQAF